MVQGGCSSLAGARNLRDTPTHAHTHTPVHTCISSEKEYLTAPLTSIHACTRVHFSASFKFMRSNWCKSTPTHTHTLTHTQHKHTHIQLHISRHNTPMHACRHATRMLSFSLFSYILPRYMHAQCTQYRPHLPQPLNHTHTNTHSVRLM